MAKSKTEIATLIESAKQAYSKAGLDCGDGLLPPIADAKINALGKAIRLKIPRELSDVYRVHGGQNYFGAGVSGLFGSHRLHTPDEVVEHYEMFQENCLLDPLPKFPPKKGESGYWVPQLIPFASWDAYDLCIHALSEEVWDFCPNHGLSKRRPSIAAVLREIIDAVESGGDPELRWE